MDSLELLAREDEFKKLNKQLEKKTESLMKQIEQSMHKQDFFAEFSPSLKLSPVHTTKKHNCNTHRTDTPPQTQPKYQNKKTKSDSTEQHRSSSKFENRSSTTLNNAPTNDRCDTKFENKTARSNLKNEIGSDVSSNVSDNEHSIEQNRSRIACDCCVNRNNIEDKEFLYAFVTVNVKNKVLPQSFLKDRPAVESVCKFLSSKVKLMQEQIDKIQSTLDKKASQCDSHLTQLADLESERMTLLNKCNNLKASTADMKAKYMALQHRLEEKEKQYLEQRSLSDKLSCEVKQLRTQTISLEAKCATQQESVDNLTQQLVVVKKADKEFKESTRSLSVSHQNAISELEMQLKAQVHRMEKQMALIDNLRRQNVLLSTEAAVNGLEKDYCAYLEKDF
ncbi:unnamed protein product [Arctia plantaginis]|uniref:Uncharacterized protein n=1 Tax=Arctia plantaginis TaxID=874455 RepID=A0A8S0YUP3_ARCPL|nr:unnamed protein product [Arctia plantaginis]